MMVLRRSSKTKLVFWVSSFASLILFGCTKIHTSGNAEGFGGGDPDSAIVETGRAKLVDAIQHVQMGYNTASLCQFHGCPAAMDKNICQVLINLTPTQTQDCHDFIVNTASNYLSLNTSAKPVQFALTTDNLTVTAPDGSQMSVNAMTPYGPTGNVLVNRIAIEGLTAMKVVMLITHEIGHKISEGSGGYVDDNSAYLSFNFAGGSRAFLDAVGASIAYYEFQVQQPGTAARSFAHSYWTGNTGNPLSENRMLVWGGNVNNTTTKTGLIYDPLYQSWSNINPTGTPTQRTRYAGFWTGNSASDPKFDNMLIVWGGSDHGKFINTGAIYNPASNSWSPISGTNAPSVRAEAVGVNNNPQNSNLGVWTGKEMIIWGGWSDDGSGNGITLGDGAAYNPSTDSWRKLSSVGAPSPRSGSAVVWTGSEMIVWGGVYNGPVAGSSDSTIMTNLGDGAIYHPSSDTWTPIRMTGAPTPRKNTVAIWTGSKMIVWGDDVSNEANPDNGALYDPNTDTWSPMSNVGAPLHHNETSAVWTGSKMIVFGGSNGGNQFSDGGIYDLAKNTWAAIPTPQINGNPMAIRKANAAVWTGSNLIIWGGTGSKGDRSDGGIFDPSTGLWIATH